MSPTPEIAGEPAASPKSPMQPADMRREVIAWALAGVLLYLLYIVIEPFLNALCWAAVLAIFFYPVHRRVLARIPRQTPAALLSVSLVAILLVAPVAWLVPAFVSQAAETVSALPVDEIRARAQQFADTVAARWPNSAGSFEEAVSEGIRGVRGRLGGWSAQLAGNFAGLIVDVIVLVLAMFYLFREGPWLVRLLRDISPFSGDRHDCMMAQAADMVAVTISSGFFVSAVQGTLGGLAFAVLGLPSPIFWGVAMGFMALLPFVGAWLIWAPAAVGLLLSGEIGRGIALLLLGALVVSAVDNVLRPALIAGRSRLNALLVFISVLGGMRAFGLLGAVAGPLVVAVAAGLLTGYRESLRSEPSASEPCV